MTVFLLVLAVPTLADGAVIIVNSVLDKVDLAPGDGIVNTGTPGEVTLRAAIMEANALVGADEIQLPAGTYTLSIAGTGEDAAATGDLDITDDLTISGGGVGATTINGAGLDRVFEVFAGVTVNLSGVQITGGNVTGINGGGGIRNLGTLTITNSTVSGNTTPHSFGSGIYSDNSLTLIDSTVSDNNGGGGGGIMNWAGTLTVSNSTISGNTGNYRGGGIFIRNTATLLNSTISGNRAGRWGGGLYVHSGATLTLTHCTVSANTYLPGPLCGGRGICNFGATYIKSTIIAGNIAGYYSDVFGTLTSWGYNLIGDINTQTITPQTGDQIGTPASPIDPLLGPLQDNGGPTFTHALLPGSPAINAGDNTGAPPTDQRGEPRIATVDIGAYEAMISNSPPVADAGADQPGRGC